jgi:alpha-1,3-rhamnosyl/mannosyltransferase
VRDACEFQGYVTDDELATAYRESLGLVVLSDYEAFCLPVLEALACGTPVFLARQAATASVFGSVSSVHLCPADDDAAVADIITSVVTSPSENAAAQLHDREVLTARFDWSHVAERKWEQLKSAWFFNNQWSWDSPRRVAVGR